MSKTALDRIRSISRASRILIAAIAAGTCLVGLYVAWLAAFRPAGFDSLASASIASPVTITAPVRAAVLVLQGGGIALMLWLLRSLWTVFGRFEQGAVFDAPSGAAVRMAGFASLANAAYLLLFPTLATLLLTVNNPSGQRALSIAFNTQQILALLMAGFFIAIGHVLTLGAALDEDSKSIV